EIGADGRAAAFLGRGSGDEDPAVGQKREIDSPIAGAAKILKSHAAGAETGIARGSLWLHSAESETAGVVVPREKELTVRLLNRADRAGESQRRPGNPVKAESRIQRADR